MQHPGTLFLIIFLPSITFAQVAYDFDEPIQFDSSGWIGDTSLFEIENGYLHLNAPREAGMAFLSFPSDIINNATWEFALKFDFNPSASNYAKIYLALDPASLSDKAPGYYLRIGGADDDVSLFYSDSDKDMLLIDGNDDLLNNSEVWVSVRVLRDSTGFWQLQTRVDSLSEFSLEGTIQDTSLDRSSYFGIGCHFTATRSEKFYFYYFYIDGSPYQDYSAPVIDSVNILNQNQLLIQFNEIIDSSTLPNSSIFASEPFQNKVEKIRLNDEALSATITFEDPFLNGYNHTFYVSGITDVVGNILEDTTFQVLYFQDNPIEVGDIVINEILPDPNPSQSLPRAEFVELWNISDNPVNLGNWNLQDTRTTTWLDEFILLPDSFLILTATANKEAFMPYGSVLGLNPWPALNNNSDSLLLFSSDSALISMLAYTADFYVDGKEDGGWSLEVRNPKIPCRQDDNWGPSIDLRGGTPGEMNSIFDPTPDTAKIQVLNIRAVTQDTLAIEFNKKLEDTQLRSAKFLINDILAEVIIPDERTDFTLLRTPGPLVSFFSYQLKITDLHDCWGNSLLVNEFDLEFDLEAPQIDSIYFVYHNQVDILFNEDIFLNDFIDVDIAGLSHPIALKKDTNQENHLILIYDTLLLDPFQSTLRLMDLEDSVGNRTRLLSYPISYDPPPIAGINDLVISEIMAAPLFEDSTLDFEYVEIFNPTNNHIPLRGYQLGDNNSFRSIDNGIIGPSSYMFFISGSSVENAESMNLSGIIGLKSWPAFNNSSDAAILKNNRGVVIDKVEYSASWHSEAEKMEGGWSLERINLFHPCSQRSNWSSSIHDLGGTPGWKNSVDSPSPDTTLLRVDQIVPLSRRDLELTLNKSIVASLIDSSKFRMNDISILVNLNSDITDSFILVLAEPMISNLEYTLIVDGLTDCWGNPLETPKYILKYDFDAPEIDSIYFEYHNRMELVFNESIILDELRPSDFEVSGEGSPADLIFDDSREDRVSLIYDTLWLEEFSSMLSIKNLTDIYGNVDQIITREFQYIPPRVADRHEIIITEIMADPVPDNPQLNYEYVELFNLTEYKIPLVGYVLADNRTEARLDHGYLEPLSYGLLIPNGNEDIQVENVIRLKNWPGLNNAGDNVILKNISGDTVHRVDFDLDWYDDMEKESGGWSLEMIDPYNPCGENSNWTASINPSGGTPGSINSVFGSKPDLNGPEVIRAWAISSDTIFIQFSEKIEPNSLRPELWNVSPDLGIYNIYLRNSHKEAYVVLRGHMIKSLVYELKIQGLTDCSGNILNRSSERLRIVVPEPVDGTNLVISEILFNPYPGGSDFIELYNNSGKYLDLEGIKIANAEIKTRINKPLYLEPNNFIVFTEDPQSIFDHYPHAPREKIHRSDLPSWPDVKGLVRISTPSDSIIDEINYHENMHFELYTDVQGVSLERISVEEGSDNLDNWKSAVSEVGFATPGLLNSQTVKIQFQDNALTVLPRVFDPEGSTETFTTISYAFDKPGYVGTISIFNLQGRVVNTLVANGYLPQKGFFTWDGLMENGSKAPVGYYIILFRIFDLEGNVRTFKEKVVVGTRF